MYKQITHHTSGKVSEREIDDQKMIELLVQMHILKQCGENIKVETNACAKNKWQWDKITATRSGKTGECKIEFTKM